MKILISDPTIHNRQHLAAYLDQSGLEVIGLAASGKETQAMAADLRPTAILLDANLPGPDMDVYELIGVLQRINPPPAVILMTTSPDPQVVRRGLLAGASACIAKSEGIDPLLDTIHQTRINYQEGA